MRQRTARALDLVERALRLQRKKQGKRRIRYFVPSLWGGPRGAAAAVKVDPFAYYLGVVRKIKRGRAVRPTGRGGEWSQKAVIYNMFVRTTAAFDHNRDGKLDLDAPLFRETPPSVDAAQRLPEATASARTSFTSAAPSSSASLATAAVGAFGPG